MPKELFFVYCYNDDGRYGPPIMAEGLQAVTKVVASKVPDHREIRVTDVLDCLVFCVVDGEIRFSMFSMPVDEEAPNAAKHAIQN